MGENLWQGVFNLLTPEYQTERKKKEEAEANYDCNQYYPLLHLLDQAETVLKESTIRQTGKRTEQYLALLESCLFLSMQATRTKIGREVVLFFSTLQYRGKYVALFKDKAERLSEYQAAREDMISDIERLKTRIRQALPEETEKEIQAADNFTAITGTHVGIF